MARLSEMPYGKLMQFMTVLGKAGLTAELAEAVSRTPRVAEMLVDVAREHITEPKQQANLRGLYDNNQSPRHFVEGIYYEWGDVLQFEIDRLGLSSRILHKLKGSAGIDTVGELMEWNEIELGDIPMVGGGTINAIKVRLSNWGLKLSDHKWDDPQWIDVWPDLGHYGYPHRVPRGQIGRFTLSRVLRRDDSFLRPSLDPEAVSIAAMACEQLTVFDAQRFTLSELQHWAHEFDEQHYCSEDDQDQLSRLVVLIRGWLHEHNLLP